MTDYISRADAIEAVRLETAILGRGLLNKSDIISILEALPSADAVSREEYEETDGVVKIKKQSAKEVGEIKHIIVCSPNYTRYFYNDSMPMQYKGGDEE